MLYNLHWSKEAREPAASCLLALPDFPVSINTNALWWSDDSSTVAFSAAKGPVYVLSLPAWNGKAFASDPLIWRKVEVGMDGSSGINLGTFLAGSARFVAACNNRADIGIGDAQTGEVVWTVDWSLQCTLSYVEDKDIMAVSRAAFYQVSAAPNGRWMAAHGDARCVVLFRVCDELQRSGDAQDGPIADALTVEHIFQQAQYVFSSRFTADSRFLLTGCSRGQVNCYDVEQRTSVFVREMHPKTVSVIRPLKSSSYFFTSAFSNDVLVHRLDVEGRDVNCTSVDLFPGSKSALETTSDWYNPFAVSERAGLIVLTTSEPDYLRACKLLPSMVPAHGMVELCFALTVPDTDACQHLARNDLFEPNVLRIITSFLSGTSTFNIDSDDDDDE